MYDYSTLPSICLNEIFDYLSFKERIKIKSVCRDWRDEIESKDKKKDAIFFHLHFFPINRKWSWPTNKNLIRIENSFEIKNIEFLRSSFVKNYFKNLKKISICNPFTVYSDQEDVTSIHQYLAHFEQCESLELFGFQLAGKTTIKMKQLKILIMKKAHCNHLVLESPNLEFFSCWSRVKKIDYKNEQNLKYLECYNHCLNFKSNCKFINLESIIFYNQTGQAIRNDLLKYTPKLKKFILFSSFQNDLSDLRRQRKIYGFNDLKISCSGFEDGVIIRQIDREGAFLIDAMCLEDVFNNYSKFDSPTNLESGINYDTVSRLFKILPDDFFTKVQMIGSLYIDEIENYNHLFEFLKNCPVLDCLTISFCKMTRPYFLDHLFMLTPSLRILAFNCEHRCNYVDFDLTFLNNLKLINVRLEASFLSINFLRKILHFTKHLISFNYVFKKNVYYIHHFDPKFDITILKQFGAIHVVNSSGFFREQFNNFEEAINFIRVNPFSRSFIK